MSDGAATVAAVAPEKAYGCGAAVAAAVYAVAALVGACGAAVAAAVYAVAALVGACGCAAASRRRSRRRRAWCSASWARAAGHGGGCWSVGQSAGRGYSAGVG